MKQFLGGILATAGGILLSGWLFGGVSTSELRDAGIEGCARQNEVRMAPTLLNTIEQTLIRDQIVSSRRTPPGLLTGISPQDLERLIATTNAARVIHLAELHNTLLPLRDCQAEYPSD